MDDRSSFFKINLFLTFFLAFSGYYVVLMLVSNYGGTSLSRYFTIPIRLLLLLSFFYFFKQSEKTKNNKAHIFFLIFAGLYLLRIFYEIVFGITEYYMSKNEFLLYFVSFVLLPFYFISRIKFSSEDYKFIFNGILVSCFLLSVVSFIFYRDLIGRVSRISMEISKDENYISPLALSYCASLGMGIGVSYLLTNKTNLSKKVLILLAVLSCLVPFFLGASRGSIFSLVLPFLFYLFFSRGVKRKFQIFFSILIGVIILIYTTNFFGTGIFDRFFSTSEAIEQGNSSAIRLEIWKKGFIQFLDNPLFGNSLESDLVHHHPHNIIIEILITTGFVGFAAFLIFLILLLKKSIAIIRKYPQYLWIVFIMLQGFIQNMFSGAIWGASWFAIGAALILGFSLSSVKNEKNINYSTRMSAL